MSSTTIFLTTYAIGFFIWLIYSFFFHKDAFPGEWKVMCLFSFIGFGYIPIYIAKLIIKVFRLINVDKLRESAFKWRENLFKKSSPKSLPQLPLPAIDQKVSDYRTAPSCSECGK